jgi:hypothetical protein
MEIKITSLNLVHQSKVLKMTKLLLDIASSE